MEDALEGVMEPHLVERRGEDKAPWENDIQAGPNRWVKI